METITFVYHGDENLKEEESFFLLFRKTLMKDFVSHTSFSRRNNNEIVNVFVSIFFNITMQQYKTKRIKIFNHEMFLRTFNALVLKILKLKLKIGKSTYMEIFIHRDIFQNFRIKCIRTRSKFRPMSR